MNMGPREPRTVRPRMIVSERAKKDTFENCDIDPIQDDSNTIDFHFDLELYSNGNLVETISQLCSIPAYFEIYSLSKVLGSSFSGGVTQNSVASSLVSSFTLEMHHNDAFDEIIKPSNAIIIGKTIYLQILVSNIPSYLDYQVEKCFAHPPDNTGTVFIRLKPLLSTATTSMLK